VEVKEHFVERVLRVLLRVLLERVVLDVADVMVPARST
jgi:hypothetical protein